MDLNIETINITVRIRKKENLISDSSTNQIHQLEANRISCHSPQIIIINKLNYLLTHLIRK
jgi:hypothetical protein